MSRGHPNNFVSSVGISLSKYQALRSGRLMKLLVSLSRHRCILFCTISFFLSMIVMSRMQLYFESHEYATHRELLVETFQLHDESTGEKALHPSKPFFVMEDESSGKILLSLDDKELGHPLNRLADLRSPREEGRETVFFFHVPKAHGKIIKNILTNCFSLRRAEKIEDPESLAYIGGVLNVDTQSRKGLVQARSANLIESGLVDVIDTSYFFEGLLLFKPSHRARIFTILRHPVHQAEQLFHAQKKIVSFEEFLTSDNYHDNWLVRSLTNDKSGEVTEDHLSIAKGILARKFIVGISEYLEESLKRLKTYFGWQEKDDGCLEYFLDEYHTVEKENEQSAFKRGGDYWKLVTQTNHYDMELYFYALELFTKQGSTMFKRPYVDKDGVPIDFIQVKKERLERERLQREEAIKRYRNELIAKLNGTSTNHAGGGE